jgi:hypothetical protein
MHIHAIHASYMQMVSIYNMYVYACCITVVNTINGRMVLQVIVFTTLLQQATSGKPMLWTLASLHVSYGIAIWPAPNNYPVANSIRYKDRIQWSKNISPTLYIYSRKLILLQISQTLLLKMLGMSRRFGWGSLVSYNTDCWPDKNHHITTTITFP